MINSFNPRFGLYSRKSKPFGKSWEEWVGVWWKWSLEGELNGYYPMRDKTGEYCDKNQFDSDVWFLAGTIGGSAVRKCIVSKKKSIFFPIVNDLISFAEYKHLNTIADLFEYARADLDTTKVLEANINGIEVQNLGEYRVQSTVFDIILPPSITNGDPLPTQAISDGYWIFIKCLPVGNYTIYFKGKKLAYDEVFNAIDGSVEPEFEVEVKYYIIVV